MKSKAQVSERFRDFDANLTTRPWIVIGMGLRKFAQIMKFKNYGLWTLIVIVYLLNNKSKVVPLLYFGQI